MFSEKLRYFLWALANCVNRDVSCPFCRTRTTGLVRRKALVTSLWECNACGLRFRVPKESPESSEQFYQKGYNESLTTDCPSPVELAGLLSSNFAGSEADYGPYIEVLKALPLDPGDTILDFGSSWGYGSWQLARAGFTVYSYEISRSRAAYARTQLQCRVVETLRDIPKKVQCFFSAHVIEHLPDPHVLWRAAVKTLDPAGMMVTFCPNGDPRWEKIQGPKSYHQLWGQKHPLVLNDVALREMARHYGFTPYVFSSAYGSEEIRSRREPRQLAGKELLLLAQRS